MVPSTSSLFLEVLYGVDWTEPWLLGLLAFHLLTAVAIILLRHHTYLQAAILSILAFLCFFTESINECAAENYSLFSEEQYFDASGFFIVTVFSIPLLLNCFLIVAWWLYSVWDMMVKVGAMKQRIRQRKENLQKGNPQKENLQKGNQEPTKPQKHSKTE